ncbi:hypothetical protein JO972_05385 [Verrucomicrobiaceae bacterium 5K15]|uniref:D-glutamate N-acetyltransferase-like N-terminal domain-containing protein n=1 Tax=Oceaniferula flava TaxID=2800421 RepID=A0AAE2SAP7_9BACT|nr:DUF1611 domain-containing protein [Oceaniferula flavus]MBK1854378.1 hypothetical protein [Oceaniferula flavus]MBM1135684.1 hypothetical protein [Oceaniferula flavus]
MHPKQRQPDPNSIFFNKMPVSKAITLTEEQVAVPEPRPARRAIVYCEGHLGEDGGKITDGLLRHSDQYTVISVIDDENAGKDSGKVLKNEPNKIPVFRNLGTALAQAGRVPYYFVFGFTPKDGELSEGDRRVMLRAMGYGMNIACAMHEELNKDPEFIEAAAQKEVTIQAV